jgi:hypothetical protein
MPRRMSVPATSDAEGQKPARFGMLPSDFPAELLRSGPAVIGQEPFMAASQKRGHRVLIATVKPAGARNFEWSSETSTGAQVRISSAEAVMKLGLDGKVVLITGGSEGLGLACARAFRDDGRRLGSSRAPSPTLTGREMLGEVGGYAADLRDPVAARAALDAQAGEFGPVDVLVKTAGAAHRPTH